VYGGFSGIEISIDQWDWVLHTTTLSGDIGEVGNSADNSWHVVVGTDNACIDGFTITGGNEAGPWPDNMGGGMYNVGSSPTVTNCTFSGNSAPKGGGMCNSEGSTPTVTNCILWDNSSDQIYNKINSNPVVTYSDVQGGYSGEGNIDTDPLFIDTDLHLNAQSPCVGAGNNNAVPEDILDLDGDGDTTEKLPFELDGNLRIQRIYVDMGAFETNFKTRIPQVAAGWTHSVGLCLDETVVAEGYNSNGQLDVEGWNNIIQIAASKFHTVGLKANGTVTTTGANTYGELDVSDWSDIVSIGAGEYTTLGVRSGGTVIAIGLDEYGETEVEGWTNVVHVDGGVFHTLGLKADGTVIAAGWNDYGQCNVSEWHLSGIKLEEVWVDDDWVGLSAGEPTGNGHTFGEDAFAAIQDGIDNLASPGTVYVAEGTYEENIVIYNQNITLQGGYLSSESVVATPIYLYSLTDPDRSRLSQVFYPEGFEGWTYHSQFFYAFAEQLAGTEPIYQYHSEWGPNRFLYTKNPDFVSTEYTRDGVAFYAFLEEVANSVPIYRYHHTYIDRTTFCYSTACVPDGFSGWIYDGLAFHAFTEKISRNSSFYVSVINGNGLDNTVHVLQTDGVTIDGFEITGGLGAGLRIEESSGTVSNDSINGNDGAGLQLVNSPDCVIESNQIHNNMGDGIFLEDTSYSVIKDNEIRANQENGINGTSTDNYTISGNVILSNGRWGVNVFDSDLVNNVIAKNGGGGILVQEAPRIYNKTIADNQGTGVELGTSTEESYLFNNVVWGNELNLAPSVNMTYSDVGIESVIPIYQYSAADPQRVLLSRDFKPGGAAGWDYHSMFFYAYEDQIEGTEKIYQYHSTWGPYRFLYTKNPDFVSTEYTKDSVAFYALSEPSADSVTIHRYHHTYSYFDLSSFCTRHRTTFLYSGVNDEAGFKALGWDYDGPAFYAVDTGHDNICEPPGFINPEENDYRLRFNISPCIDKGLDVVELFETDFEGDPRCTDGNRDGLSVIDMGADEVCDVNDYGITSWRQEEWVDLKPGDILIDSSPGLFSTVLGLFYGDYWVHTGIYAGNGQVIEAIADGVSITSISA